MFPWVSFLTTMEISDDRRSISDLQYSLKERERHGETKRVQVRDDRKCKLVGLEKPKKQGSQTNTTVSRILKPTIVTSHPKSKFPLTLVNVIYRQ